MLVGRFPGQQVALDDLYVAYLNGIPDTDAKTNGILVGEEVGVGMLLLRANDGLDSIVPYVQPPPGPGVYEPTAPATPVGTRCRSCRWPWRARLSSAKRPRSSSGDYAQDFNEVKDLGRFDSSLRSAEQTALARFWTDSDIPQWNRNLLRLADARGLTAIETARMLAMAHVAGGDAMIGCFDAKYHYLSWRPLHAIQRADTDNALLLHRSDVAALVADAESSRVSVGPCLSHHGDRRSPRELLRPRSHQLLARQRGDRGNALLRPVQGRGGRGQQRSGVGGLPLSPDEDGSKLGRKVARFVVTNFFQPLD